MGRGLLHKTRHLSVSQRRADWFRRWTSEVASSSTVYMGSFEEGLGRVMFVAGALEYERPFFGPLYKVLTLHPRDSIRAVPPQVSFFLRYLSDQITQCRHHDCSSRLFPDQLAPRVDALASAEQTGIGGWFPRVDLSGKVNVAASRWFSHETTRDEWSWVFEKSSKPALVISTLEALAVLIALKVYYGEEPKADHSSIRTVPTTTDNRVNGAALNKLMTTMYPASAVLMELAAYSKMVGLRASVEWSPREANREADALADGDFSPFTPELRIPVSAQRLQWTILMQALDLGRVRGRSSSHSEAGGLPEESEEETTKTTGGETENGGPLVISCWRAFHIRHTHSHLHAAFLSTCFWLFFSSSVFRGSILLLDDIVPLFPLLCIVPGIWRILFRSLATIAF